MVNLVAKVKLITEMPFKPTAKQNKMQKTKYRSIKDKEILPQKFSPILEAAWKGWYKQ